MNDLAIHHTTDRVASLLRGHFGNRIPTPREVSRALTADELTTAVEALQIGVVGADRHRRRLSWAIGEALHLLDVIGWQNFGYTSLKNWHDNMSEHLPAFYSTYNRLRNVYRHFVVDLDMTNNPALAQCVVEIGNMEKLDRLRLITTPENAIEWLTYSQPLGLPDIRLNVNKVLRWHKEDPINRALHTLFPDVLSIIPDSMTYDASILGDEGLLEEYLPRALWGGWAGSTPVTISTKQTDYKLVITVEQMRDED